MGMTFPNTGGGGPETVAQMGAVSGDPGGPYLPQHNIGKLVFLLFTKHSQKANSFSWVSIYYHLKCHSLYG